MFALFANYSIHVVSVSKTTPADARRKFTLIKREMHIIDFTYQLRSWTLKTI